MRLLRCYTAVLLGLALCLAGLSAPRLAWAQNHPRPVVNGLDPAYGTAGDADTRVTIRGSGFVAGAVVLFEDEPLTPDSVGATAITVTVPSALLATAGDRGVVVVNPDPSDGPSNLVTFTVDPAVPEDTSAPVTTPVPSGAAGLSGWYVSGVSVTLDATDDAGVAGTRYGLDGGGEQGYGGPIRVSGDGTHTLEFWSVDVNGNEEVHQTETFHIDGAAPVSTAVGAVDGGEYRNGVVITFGGSDATSGLAAVVYTVDGGPDQAAGNGQSVSVGGAGEHTVTYHAVDIAGNVEGTHRITFTIVSDVAVSRPAISGIDPDYVEAGSPDTVIVITGTGFNPGASVVSVGGTVLAPVAGVTSTPTSLAVTIPAGLLAAPGTLGVTVTNGDGGSAAYDVEVIEPVGIETAAPVDVAVGPDNRTYLLWGDPAGTTDLWVVGADGGVVKQARFGPYAGWKAVALSVGGDNRLRVLWNNLETEETGWWLLSPGLDIQGHVAYGPLAGWAARDIAAGPDGRTRILWNHLDGRAGLWTVNDAGVIDGYGLLGAYPDWLAQSLAVGTDNKCRVLWTHVDGSLSLWRLSKSHALETAFVFGALAGWTATDLALDGQDRARLLWEHVDGRTGLWTLGTAGQLESYATFPYYPGWLGRALAVGGDGRTRVLWDYNGEQGGLWVLSPEHRPENHFLYSPF